MSITIILNQTRVKRFVHPVGVVRWTKVLEGLRIPDANEFVARLGAIPTLVVLGGVEWQRMPTR
jgi:hypothetical protein